MTRDQPDPTDSTEESTEDEHLPEHEHISTNQMTDPDLTRARHLASQLSHFDLLNKKEAQAFAFRELAGFDQQRTAEETDLSPSSVDVYLCSAQVRITTARKYLNIINDAR